MNAWLSIAVAAGAQVLSQLICVAGAIWQERARAASHRSQMEIAASRGTLLLERRPDGTLLLIIPDPAGRELAAAGWARSDASPEESLS